ncbi:MAG: type 2 isopentenyl-diphosphate Delta-isomerase [Dehalococcoidales bacterium]|nr:type 2 isopentenyl-diphosphate Delta-isomerase [Dehalococcoidales bacterium]
MDLPSSHAGRKEAQLLVCMHDNVQASGVTTGFEHYRFVHQALPEIDWQEMDLSVNLLGRHLRAPLFISAMTGGCRLARRINRNLAEAAQRLGIGMAVGSQRAAIIDPGLAETYQVREVAPDILLLGNLGAVQLNAGFGLAECRQAVAMIEADGLFLHLNGLQEIQQPNGDRNFRGLLPKIAAICEELGAPVLVKEVGWGIALSTAAALKAGGVGGIEVAGAGGTSWFVVQAIMAGKSAEEARGSPFASWGIPTAESLHQVLSATDGLPVIASGGIRNGVDAAKALAMGATAVGIAQPLLRPAAESSAAVVARLELLIHELRTAMFCLGAPTVAALQRTPHLINLA